MRRSVEAHEKNILRYMVNRVIKEGGLNYDKSIQAFFLLEKEGLYDWTVKLMNAYLQLNPQNYKVYYLLALAEWLNEEKGKAKKHYLQAFLYYPDRLMLIYVKYRRLKTLADLYPVEMIPAYAWLKGISSFVPIKKDSFSPLHNEHQLAFKAYGFLKKCDKHKKDKDQNKKVFYRKKLKETAPRLFEDYMSQCKKSPKF